MSKTPSLTPKDLIKLLEQKGFILDRVKGSHHIYFYMLNRNQEWLCHCTIKIYQQEHFLQFLNKQELIKTNCNKNALTKHQSFSFISNSLFNLIILVLQFLHLSLHKLH